MKKLLAVLAFSALAAFGADASGKWSGTFIINADGEIKDDSILLNLKQSGSVITGSGGPNEEKQFPITTGKIEGNKIVLNVQAEHDLMIVLTLQMDGDHITGDAKADDGEHKMTAKIDAKRQS